MHCHDACAYISFVGYTVTDYRSFGCIHDEPDDGYVVLFDRADILSPICQNALLKAIEDRDDFSFAKRDMAGTVSALNEAAGLVYDFAVARLAVDGDRTIWQQSFFCKQEDNDRYRKADSG